MKINAPCFKCKVRSAKCHDVCKLFKAYKEQLKKEKEIIYNQKLKY